MNHSVLAQWLTPGLLAVFAAAGPVAATTTRYDCHDHVGNTYRLPVAPSASDAIVCAAVEVPPPAPPVPRVAGPAAPPPWWRGLWAAASVMPLPGPPAAPTAPAAPTVPTAELRHKNSETVDSVLRDAASRYGHDVDLLRAIVHVESGFNAQAVSSKGAIGLMQVMPATARGLGMAQPHQELFDPQRNVDVGARHLRRLMDLFRDRPELAVAAYNAGENAVARYGHAIPPYPETQAYVEKVRARYIQLRRSGASRNP
jgi:hypothetical protein